MLTTGEEHSRLEWSEWLLPVSERMTLRILNRMKAHLVFPFQPSEVVMKSTYSKKEIEA